MSQVTTHVLDTAKGKPAAGINITLCRRKENDWQAVASGITNADGRIMDLLKKELVLEPGIYKMEFLTGPYFAQLQEKNFYPVVPIVFAIADAEHYHIPLLLSPFGYSTYRGS